MPATLSKELIDACAKDKFLAIETFLKVKNKTGDTVPLIVPHAFRRHLRQRKRISIWLKPRQAYLTTTADAWFYMDTLELDGINVVALNLDTKRGEENFRRVADFDEHRHPIWQNVETVKKNGERLEYANGGSFSILTIKNDASERQADELARSITARRVRWTEASFSRHYRIVKRAIVDTIPLDGQLWIETTGNGAQGGYYDDFMEVVIHGDRVEPNIWVKGDVSAHFEAWFEHDEYRMDESDVTLTGLAQEVRQLLEYNEAQHQEAMNEYGLLDADEIHRRFEWRRWMLFNKKNFLSDPHGALRNMDREYPGTYKMAFQATGHAWLSLSLLERDCERARAENFEKKLPIIAGLNHEHGKIPEINPVGNEIQFWELPIRGWKHRYCVACDPSAGLDDGDKTAIGVLDRLWMRMVAVAHGALSPAVASKILIALGAYYDFAKISWENNSLGISITERVIESAYPNVYKLIPDGTSLDAYGWNTNGGIQGTRKKMVGLLKSDYEQEYKPFRTNYIGFFDEARDFIDENFKGDPRAINGKRDDVMMMTAQLLALSALMPAVQPPDNAPRMNPAKNQFDVLSKAREAKPYKYARSF